MSRICIDFRPERRVPCGGFVESRMMMHGTMGIHVNMDTTLMWRSCVPPGNSHIDPVFHARKGPSMPLTGRARRCLCSCATSLPPYGAAP